MWSCVRDEGSVTTIIINQDYSSGYLSVCTHPRHSASGSAGHGPGPHPTTRPADLESEVSWGQSHPPLTYHRRLGQVRNWGNDRLYGPQSLK